MRIFHGWATAVSWVLVILLLNLARCRSSECDVATQITQKLEEFEYGCVSREADKGFVEWLKNPKKDHLHSVFALRDACLDIGSATLRNAGIVLLDAAISPEKVSKAYKGCKEMFLGLDPKFRVADKKTKLEAAHKMRNVVVLTNFNKHLMHAYYHYMLEFIFPVYSTVLLTRRMQSGLYGGLDPTADADQMMRLDHMLSHFMGSMGIVVSGVKNIDEIHNLYKALDEAVWGEPITQFGGEGSDVRGDINSQLVRRHESHAEPPPAR
jgi:hypothetical protein